MVLAKFALIARRDSIRKFVSTMDPRPDATVLDVGVTPDQTAEDSNYFEQWYPHTEMITATSIEDASCLETQYPGLTFIRTAGTDLPFEDAEFDIAFSSGVIEHAGTRRQQQMFLAELLRWCRTASSSRRRTGGTHWSRTHFSRSSTGSRSNDTSGCSHERARSHGARPRT